MKILKLFSASLLLIFFCVNVVSAHQPRLVEDENVKVENPEISRAFYGELTGEPVYYEINSNESFDLYVGVLVPDAENIDKDISVEISKEGSDGKIILDGENFEWIEYYEEHAGDNYFSGPYVSEEDADQAHPKGVRVESGKYILKVFSPDNQGKYVLVVGDQESFPVREIIRTVTVMPSLKKYFEKSWAESFTTPTMIGFLVISIVVVFTMTLLFLWVLRFSIRKMKEPSEQ